MGALLDRFVLPSCGQRMYVCGLVAWIEELYIARLKQADQLFEETHDFRLSTAPVEGWLREVFEQKLLNDPSD